MNAKHTPGPWTVENYGDDDEAPALVIHKDSESRVCFMATPGSHDDPAEIEANAKLIASAPDMLALLEEIVEPTGRDVVDTLKEIRTKARALIAKATGQP